MRKRTFLKYGMLTALCLALLGGCGSGEEPADTQEETGYWREWKDAAAGKSLYGYHSLDGYLHRCVSGQQYDS